MGSENINEIIVLKKTLKILRLCFLFPSNEEIKNPANNIYKKYILLSLVASYLPVGALIHLIVSIVHGTQAYIFPDLMVLLNLVGPNYFNFNYLSRVKKLVVLYQKLSDFETFGKPVTFESVNNFLNKIWNYYFIYNLIIFFGMTYTNLFSIQQCKEENRRLNISETCGYYARIWLPFDYDYIPFRQMMLLYQGFAMFVVCHNAGMISIGILEAIIHVSLRFQHVSETFINIVQEIDPVIRKAKFGKAVEYHKTVLEMGETINFCYKRCMMSHICLGGPVLGFAGYKIVTDFSAYATGVYVLWFTGLGLVCYGGQKLQDESKSLGDILYNVDWYKLEPELQRDIMFIIMRSRKPVMLWAGPVGVMTYDMMVKIVKSSYSFLALLQTI